MLSGTGRRGTHATTPILEPTVMCPDDDQASRRRLAGFDPAEANKQWSVVNDDVMGGESLGRLSFEAGILVFEGEINTDGGGFASLRMPLEPGNA